MLKTRNWTIPVILSGIIFFTLIGYLLSSEAVNLNEYRKTIVVYWCLGISFASLLCLSLFKAKTFKKSKKYLLEKVLFFPLSILLTATQIELGFFPIVTFFMFIVSWILWAVLRSENKGNDLTLLNILIISWMVLSLTVTVGQFLGFSDVLISKIYAFNVFLDLRITLSIIITSIILIMSLGKIDFSKIETKELLKIKNDKGNPLLIIVGLFFVLANFLIQIGWWLSSFILLWGQECVSSMKKKAIETKNTLFDLSIILFSILGLYASHKLSQFMILEYLPLNKAFEEIIPFIYITFLTSMILLAAYMVIRIRYLNWNNWKLVINKNDFNKADREYREAIAFPILTSGLAGIILFGLSKLTTLNLIYYKNFGFFSWFLSIGLLAAIIITMIKHFSYSSNKKYFINNKKDNNES